MGRIDKRIKDIVLLMKHELNSSGIIANITDGKPFLVAVLRCTSRRFKIVYFGKTNVFKIYYPYNSTVQYNSHSFTQKQVKEFFASLDSKFGEEFIIPKGNITNEIEYLKLNFGGKVRSWKV